MIDGKVGEMLRVIRVRVGVRPRVIRARVDSNGGSNESQSRFRIVFLPVAE